MKRTKKQITVDDLLENSVSVNKNDLENIKKQLQLDRLEKMLKRKK
jgi:hypothetical protein